MHGFLYIDGTTDEEATQAFRTALAPTVALNHAFPGLDHMITVAAATSL